MCVGNKTHKKIFGDDTEIGGFTSVKKSCFVIVLVNASWKVVSILRGIQCFIKNPGAETIKTVK